MIPPNPRILWLDSTPSGTFRLLDMGAGESPRFRLEQQQPPDALGGQGWSSIGLPFADVLEKALAALLGAA